MMINLDATLRQEIHPLLPMVIRHDLWLNAGVLYVGTSMSDSQCLQVFVTRVLQIDQFVA